MLSNKPSLGFATVSPSSRFKAVLGFNFVVIGFILLMIVAAFGAADSENKSDAANLSMASQPLVTPTVSVFLSSVNTPSNVDITVSILINGDVTGVDGYEAFMTFDNTALTFLSCDTTGTLSDGLITPSCGASYPGHPERLYISTNIGSALSGSSGALVNLNFHVTNNYCNSPDIGFGGWGSGPAFSFFGGSARNAITTDNAVQIFGAVTGTITYGNAIGNPTPPRNVPNVLLSATSSTNFSTTSNSSGVYTLDRFNGAALKVVTPSKPNGNSTGSISSSDAAKISQFVAMSATPSTEQAIVADVSGNGSISSFDAAQVATYVASSCGSCGSTGNWIFSPTSRSYGSCPAYLTGEDYSALQMGEVTGNWPNGGSGRSTGPERPVAVLAPNLVASSEKEVNVPINVQLAADKGITSYEFNLRYDPSVILPAADIASVTKTASHNLSVVTNAQEPGLLRVVVYGAYPIDGGGVLLNLRFTAVGTQGSISPLILENFIFNEGDPTVTTTDGQVELSTAVQNTTAEDR